MNQRFPIFATRMNQKLVQHKLKTSERGYKLLKSKSDALQLHYRKVEKELNGLNTEIEKIFKNAFLSLKKAEFAGANIELFKKNCSKFPIKLLTEVQIISGVKLPTFTIQYLNENDEEYLERGGSQLLETKIQFKNLINLLVEVCSIKNSFILLKENLDATNRRVNSLEHLIIPKLENTLRFISSELDEQEREDFFRLKKIKNVNKK